ncbi:hypothetical protein CN288_12550 [Bacillus sp. AFS023182]|uniref:hypothetical protein n=1 Tax=Bacillus sp. AFS023182 TaxID=2033492 RepID=UPI000BF49E14|nr:hypothetical protein [Bacillus sp. AFS023182]PFE03801.1 hypothetical protein CN288_12550 [Bacillus sp. AFS023182]
MNHFSKLVIDGVEYNESGMFNTNGNEITISQYSNGFKQPFKNFQYNGAIGYIQFDNEKPILGEFKVVNIHDDNILLKRPTVILK